MNKQELIKAVIELPVDCSGPRPKIDQLTTLELIKLLDEPPKPVVPQFVADWIDVCKEKLAVGLYIALNPDFVKQYSKSNELIAWVRKYKNQEVFARAWIFGYEVEREKRYLVKVKGLEKKKCYLNYNFGGVWLIYNQDNFGGYRAHHTRKELEDAGFGWVFDCPGIEIEEVE